MDIFNVFNFINAMLLFASGASMLYLIYPVSLTAPLVSNEMALACTSNKH